MDDFFLTIFDHNTCELKEKGSRFICSVFYTNSVKQAEEIVSETSKKYYDATHNCFAYCIDKGVNQVTRFNDDGEPSGTAGKPILKAIAGRNLTNVTVIITRYFGGTKLGTGGLIRAYGGAAAQVLDTATIKKVYAEKKLLIHHAFDHSKTIMNAVQKFSAKVVSLDYDDKVHLTTSLRIGQVNEFCSLLVNRTSGNVQIEEL